MQQAGASPLKDTKGDSRTIALACALGLAGITLIWATKLLGGEGAKALDAFEYHYPTYAWLYGAIAEGRLPLWNPHQLCGIPTLDTLQNGAFYPLHLLHVVWPTDLSMAVSGWLHLVLIGGSTFAFALRARLGVWPALLAGLLVATRGAQPGHIVNPSMQEASAWLAVGFIGVLAAVRGRPLHAGVWIAIATGMSLLAGFPQSSVYAAYAWALGALGLSIGTLAEWRRPALALTSVIGGVALGALIAAVVLLPALELAGIGARERGLLPIDLMLPYGRVGFETPLEALRFVLISRPAAPGVIATFGLSALALALLAWLPHPHRRLGAVMWMLVALCVVFALGPATPFFDLLLGLPELGAFRSPWRALFIADFALAIAAAVGLRALLDRVGAQNGERDGRSPRWRTPATAIAATAIVIAFGESLVAAPAQTQLPYDASERQLAFHHEPRPALELLVQRHDRVFTIFGGDMNGVSEKLASTIGLRSVTDLEILTLRRQREYLTWLYWGLLDPSARGATGFTERIFYGHYDLVAPGIDAAGVVARSRLLDLAAVRHVVASRSVIAEPSVHGFIRGTGLRPVDVRDPDMIVFEQPRALPRAYLSHDVADAPPVEALLTALSLQDFDPRETSYVELRGTPRPALGPASLMDYVEIVEDEAERVTLRAFSDAPALVVLADTFHPAWTAEVDGAPAPIWPTNHLFRGVLVPPGEHEIVFRYQPIAVIVGASLSGLGVTLLFGAVFWIRLRGSAGAPGSLGSHDALH